MDITYEKSCGAIVYTRDNGNIQYLIIQNIGGFFGFPKGHTEAGETEKETAVREIYEEVGIKPRFIDGFREVDEHSIPHKEGIIKQVVYFLAEYSNQKIVYQKEELLGAELMTFEGALNSLQFDGVKNILTKADTFIIEKMR